MLKSPYYTHVESSQFTSTMDSKNSEDNNIQKLVSDIGQDQTEHRGEDTEKDGIKSESISSKLSSWLTDTPTWATSLVSTAKEKTKTTFDAMRKDINEISDTVQHEANVLANATVQQVNKQAQMIQRFISTSSSEEKSDVYSDSPIGKNGNPVHEINFNVDDCPSGSENYFSFGWMKQIVSTVQRLGSEDTTKEEKEYTEEIHIGGRMSILDSGILSEIQNDKQTFLQPPSHQIDLYREWLNNFKILEYNGEINMLLSHNPNLREIYSELVPSQVENHTFWNRYFFKVYLKEVEKQSQKREDFLKVDLAKNKPGSSPSDKSNSPANSSKERDETWSLCSSSATVDAEDMDSDIVKKMETDGNERETTTPKPPKEGDEEFSDDWEDCNDGGGTTTFGGTNIKNNKGKTK